MIESKRVHVSKSLVDQLCEILLRDQSVVLLGPRNVGKRYLALRLAEALEAVEGRRVLSVAFLGGGWRGPAADFASVIKWVDARLAEGPGPVTLIASNVDACPHVQIREFLYKLRSRIEDKDPGRPGGPLSVCLTGEVDLGDFTSGPQSPLTSHSQFIIQGFAEPEFRACAMRYFTALAPPWRRAFEELELDRLYRRTGGNTYFFRLLLWSRFDRAALSQPDGPGPSPAEVVAGADIECDGELAGYYFRYISRHIDADPACWPALERLVEAGEADAPGTRPHPLELAGVAVREAGRLRIPDTLVRDYIMRHYSRRRFADLYARKGEWSQAFRRYRRVDRTERVRPTDLEDLVDAEGAVKDLRMSLYREAVRGPQSVLRLFCRGCRLVLGFREVTRWRHVDGAWSPAHSAPFNRPSAEADYAPLLARVAAEGHRGRVALDDSARFSVVAVRVGSLHPSISELILVGRPGRRDILSKARERMTDELADDFQVAYSHALDGRRLRDRQSYLGEFARIASKIVYSLGSDITDSRTALQLAARRLRELGDGRLYSRVVLSVLDASGRKVIPVALNYDETVFGEITEKWVTVPLDGETKGASATRWVVKERKPLVTPDALRDPRVSARVAEKLKVKAAAVIPMLDPRDEVVGTIQIERADGLVPTDEEVGDLVEFGRTLAVSLALIEQVNMFQRAFDTFREPIALFDPTGQTRYLNRAAAKTVSLEPRWYRTGEGPRFDELDAPDLAPGDLDQFANAVRSVTEAPAYSHLPGKLTYQGVEYYFTRIAQPLWDWRSLIRDDGTRLPGKPSSGPENPAARREGLAAVFLHARDDTLQHRTFHALEELAAGGGDRDAIIERMLKAARLLGHAWARLYMFDPDGGSGLVGCDGFGFDPATLEAFRRGDHRIAPPEGNLRWEAWHCFEEGRPVVFRHEPGETDGLVASTRRGLTYKNTRSPGCPEAFRKAPGELWIDVPVLVGNERVGKLTLDCPEGTCPDHIEFLKVFCRLISALLGGAQAAERNYDEWTLDEQQAAESKLHHEAYGILDELSQLAPALFRLREAAVAVDRETGGGKRPSSAARALVDVQEEVEAVYAQVSAAIGRRLDAPLKLVRTDLHPLFQELAAMRHDHAEVGIGPPYGPGEVVACVDGGRLLRGLVTLVRHAASVRPHLDSPVGVHVSAEAQSSDGRSWIAINMCNNGRRIPPADVSGLFEPRDRPGRRRNRSVNLVRVREMAEAHGGSVHYEYLPGAGSRFVIRIPHDSGAYGTEGRPAAPPASAHAPSRAVSEAVP